MSGMKKENSNRRFFTVDEYATPENLKRRYKDLCKLHHPDKGGSNELQAQINVEYQQALQQLTEIAERKGEQLTAERLFRQMEQHLHNIITHVQQNETLYSALYKELKVPFMKWVVPKEYHGLIDIVTIIVKRMGV